MRRSSSHAAHPAASASRPARWAALLLLAGTALQVGYAQTFTPVSAGDLTSDAAGTTSGSWADYDGDGDPDLYVTYWDGTPSVLYENRDGRFVRRTDNGLPARVGPSTTGLWADYDADGDLDLYVVNLGGRNFLYRNGGADGLFAFTEAVTGDAVTEEGRYRSGSWADYDGDGDLDLYVTAEDGARLYRNDGQGVLTTVPEHVLVEDQGDLTTPSWADYDHDGDLDLFAAHTGFERNALYRNDGDGRFTRRFDTPVAQEASRSGTGAWGDYDNDGDLDLFVPNVAGLDNSLYRNDGDGRFTKVTTSIVARDGGDSNAASWVDYDHDGDLDLFVPNRSGTSFLYAGDGDGGFTRVVDEPLTTMPGSALGAAWGDYDRDGDLDLFIPTDNGEDDRLYRNDSQGNHWLQVRVVGLPANPSAIGAVVRVKAVIGGRAVWQMREVGEENGTSRNGLDVAFGLGDAFLLDSVVVTWPGGYREVRRHLTADQHLTFAPRDPSVRFTRVEDDPVATDARSSTSGSWGDYDGDGFLDLFVTNWAGEPNLLYHNRGDGTFDAVDAGDLTARPGFSTSGSWGDYDDDGDLDLFVANLGDRAYLFRNDGQGGFTEVPDGPLVTTYGAFKTGSWADYDGDGDLDLLVTSEHGAYLFRNDRIDGTVVFTRVTEGALAEHTGSLTAAAWADYDGDRDLDVFIAHTEDEPNALFRNDGAGRFSPVTDTPLTQEAGRWASGSWGDYDNDGDLDLFVARAGGANNALFRNDGGGFTRVTSGEPVTDGGDSNHSTWGDYDNDGWLDLFVSNRSGTSFLYRNEGDGSLTRVFDEAPARTPATALSAAWGDADRDGTLDLFVATSDGQHNLYYRNSSTHNHWLHLRLVGSASNRSAVGAVVRARAALQGQPRWQMRELSEDDGLGHNAPDVAFGLGVAEQVDALVIEWPSGLRQLLAGVAADRLLTITEPASAPIQFVHAQADAGEVDVLADGHPVASGLAYGAGSAPVRLEAGVGPAFVVTRAGTEEAVTQPRLIDFKPGRAYTAVVGAARPGEAGTVLYVHEQEAPAALSPHHVSLLVFHGAPHAGAVDLQVRGGAVLARALSPRAFADGGLLPATLHVFDACLAGPQRTCQAFAVDLSPLAGQRATLVVDGTPTAGGLRLYAVGARGRAAAFMRLRSIREARSRPEGEAVAVEGVVTRVQHRVVWLQDETAALALTAEPGSVLAATLDTAGVIQPGDVLAVHGVRSAAGARAQLAGIEAIAHLARGQALPEARRLTLAQVAAGGEAYEGMLVRVEGLQLVPLRDEPFEAGAAYALRDASEPARPVVLQLPGADDTALDGTRPPFGRFTFEGVLDQSGANAETGYRLLPILAGDLRPEPSARVQLLHVAAPEAGRTVDFAVDTLRLARGVPPLAAAPFVALAAGVRRLVVSRSEGDGAGDILALLPSERLTDSTTYVAAFLQLPSQAHLFVREARQGPADPAGVDLLLVNATPSLPVFDLVLRDALFPGSETPLAEGVRYGEPIRQAPRLAAGVYTLEVRAAGADQATAVYRLDARGAAGTGLPLVLHGHLDPSDPGGTLRLLAALPAGGPLVPADVVSSVGVAPEAAEVPDALSILGSYPNPSHGATAVRFDLPEPADVRVDVVDALGRVVLRVHAGRMDAGAARTVALDAASLASGVYFFRLTATGPSGARSGTGRLAVVK